MGKLFLMCSEKCCWAGAFFKCERREFLCTLVLDAIKILLMLCGNFDALVDYSFQLRQFWRRCRRVFDTERGDVIIGSMQTEFSRAERICSQFFEIYLKLFSGASTYWQSCSQSWLQIYKVGRLNCTPDFCSEGLYSLNSLPFHSFLIPVLFLFLSRSLPSLNYPFSPPFISISSATSPLFSSKIPSPLPLMHGDPGYNPRNVRICRRSYIVLAHFGNTKTTV